MQDVVLGNVVMKFADVVDVGLEDMDMDDLDIEDVQDVDGVRRTWIGMTCNLETWT